MPAVSRTILHVDLDAFYAAVETRERPELAGRPVIVGADPRGGQGRGVVAAASYEARRYGVRSAMPISQAYRRCPQGVYLRPRMSLYAAVSRRFMDILRRYTDLVEPLSIDEAFLDVSASAALFGDGERIARRIKEDARQEERLTASIGVAPTKFVAKIASDVSKPDGLLVIAGADVPAFLAALPIERLWGAGPKTVARFKSLRVHSIGDLAAVPARVLERAFGLPLAQHFSDLARGIDPRPVVAAQGRKSLGHETTFDEDERDRGAVERTLLSLVDEVALDLRRQGLLGERVSVKLRTADFVTVTRQAALPIPCDTTDAIWPIARRLLLRADSTRKPIRLVGVTVSIGAGAGQLSLFDTPHRDRRRRIARAIDAVTARFGPGAIRPAATLIGEEKAQSAPPRTRRRRKWITKARQDESTNDEPHVRPRPRG
jgi:DNA polymerase-4